MTTAFTSDVVRRRLVVRGTVQGVGFRPYLARLAADLGLAGSCHNDAACVEVEVEGPAADVAQFEDRLVAEAPPLARVTSVVGHDAAVVGASDFAIVASTDSAAQRTTLPPDTAPCTDCLRELHDPTDRRFRHPFITCTHCGPRLSITLDLPYDRATTTMADFVMCAACAAEYTDPLDRRYHAQPIGCHDCGPSISLVDATGAAVAEGTEPVLAAAAAALTAGSIVAIKGIGGYHLACDARSPRAVALLRARKHRPDQPFAVMVRDLEVARTLVSVPPSAADLLTSPERPIVLLPALPGSPLTPTLAPALDELGMVLPYTPLHHLLLAAGPDCLVMTSGNASGEPLCFDDAEALARLGGAEPIADLFLTHDRPIAVPVEDSVIAWFEAESASGPVPVRRSRGFAPIDLPLGDGADDACVLAAGAEVKNTVALARDGRAHLSAHVGDLASLASRDAHQRVTDQMLRFHRSAPSLLVADAHPGYASRAWAQRFAAELAVPVLEVQHHHAHLASLAAEHEALGEPLLGLVLDGTGYGCDGLVWGGELLLLTDRGRSMQRLGHLGTIRLPGADAGVRNPVRTAALALLDAGVDLAAPEAADVAAGLSATEVGFLAGAAGSGTGLVETSSAGRLFDVAAALIGVRHRITYEAQAAIELEALAARWRSTHPATDAPRLSLPVLDAILDPAPLVRELATAVADGVDRGALAWAFHEALADAVAELAARQAPAGTRRVGLSGGVYVNRVLLAATTESLRAHGLDALTHHAVPANDGGLALGQVAVGASTLAHRATTIPNQAQPATQV